MRFIKVLLSLCLLFAIVILFAAFALNYLIDPNRMKPLIAAQIKQHTGSNLVIDGKLTWVFFPRFGIGVPHLSLTTPGDQKPYAELRNVNLSASLAQLWKHKNEMKGRVSIEDMVFMRLHLKDIKFRANWQNSILTIDDIAGGLYAGDVTGLLQIQPASSRWHWNLQFKDIQVAPLLADLNKTDKVSLTGTAELLTNGDTNGLTRADLLSHLDGAAEFKIQDGTINGMDINYLVQTADALINRQPISLNSTNQTTFQSFTGNVDIQKGVANSQDLTLVSPNFITQGQGSLNLVDQTINLQLQVKPQATMKSQWHVPVLVSGDLTNPQVGLDTSIIKDQFKKIKNHVEDQVKKQISDKAGAFLQNLLGG